MLFIILVLAVVLLVLSPYIIIVIKRQKMLKRITYFAGRAGFRTRRLHRFVPLSLNRSQKYDILFENREHAFAVKLWSATKKNSTLVIFRDGRVTQSTTIPYELSADGAHTLTYGARRLPKTKVNFKIKKGKPLDRFLLCYPPNKAIVICTSEGRKKLYSGDILFDKIICMPKDLQAIFAQFSQNAEK